MMKINAKMLHQTHQTTPPCCSLHQLVLGGIGDPLAGPRGPREVETENSLKILNSLEQTLQTTPHVLHLTLVGFGRYRGPFGEVPGNRVRSKSIFFSKFLTGLSRRFRRHPTWHLLLRLRKVGFRGSLGTLRRGPWGPGEVKIEFFSKFLMGLSRRFQRCPICYIWMVRINFQKFGLFSGHPEISRNFPKY